MTAILSPLRSRLCSRENAELVARRLTDEGITVSVVANHQPLQPWRVIERADDITPETKRCA